MAAVLVHLVIPADHRLVPTLHALDDAVRQELVVVGQKGRRLFRLHRKSSAQSVEDELEGALSLRRLPADVHLHDVDSVLHGLLLRRLEASPARLAHDVAHVLGALAIVLPVVIEIQDVVVTRNSFHVPLDSGEEFTDLLRVAGHIQTLDVIFDNDSNFLQIKTIKFKS